MTAVHEVSWQVKRIPGLNRYPIRVEWSTCWLLGRRLLQRLQQQQKRQIRLDMTQSLVGDAVKLTDWHSHCPIGSRGACSGCSQRPVELAGRVPFPERQSVPCLERPLPQPSADEVGLPMGRGSSERLCRFPMLPRRPNRVRSRPHGRIPQQLVPPPCCVRFG